jgi:phosphoribosylglycinamide formyltransferase-1
MKFAILGSGTGSNAKAVLTAWQQHKLGDAQPVAIFSDKENAPILGYGETFGVPARYLHPGKFKTKLDPETEQLYIQAIREAGADWVVLAGFMRVIKEDFLNAFPSRIINLHPSLLPSFKGLNAIGQAWDYGVKITGCTVHLVTGDLDGGPILDQRAVRIEQPDTLETLAQKIHAAEHELLPEVIARLSITHA